jgi:hypothetical protein
MLGEELKWIELVKNKQFAENPEEKIVRIRLVVHRSPKLERFDIFGAAVYHIS